MLWHQACVSWPVGQRRAVQCDCSGCCRGDPSNDAKQGALATSRWPEECHKRSVGYDKMIDPEDFGSIKVVADAVDYQHIDVTSMRGETHW